MFLVAMLASAVSFTASARRLSPSEALGRITADSRAGDEAFELVYTPEGAEYYVFSAGPSGYMVASGDDCVTPLLAVVPDGSFNVDSLPDAMVWLLDGYKREIAIAAKSRAGVTAEQSITALYSRWTPIEPLVQSAWSQGSPYNDLCPVVSGSRSLTGCVATAMAQIIKTIGYAKGEGKISRYYDSKLVEFDYEANPIDFDNLLNAYSYGDSQEARTAVAQLMLACGLSVSMKYSGSESAAYSSEVAPALIRYFGYDENFTRGFNREDYSTAFWESLIYEELVQGRPVYYSGSSRAGAHAFLVDGYKCEGLWHINWGWGGRSDGYFRLPDLDPSGYTADGDLSSGGGYNNSQYLVKSVPPGANPGLAISYLSGSLSVVSDDVYSVYFKSNGVFLFNLTLGALIVSEDGSGVNSWQQFWTGQNINSSGALRHESYRYDFSQANLPPGKYRIYPAIILGDSGEPIICDAVSGRIHYLLLTVDADGNYLIADGDVSAEDYSYDLHVAETGENILYAGFPGSLSVNLVNEGAGDYYGYIFFNLINAESGEKVLTASVPGVVVPGGYHTRVAASFRVVDENYADLPAGKYQVTLTNSSGVDIVGSGEEIYATVLDTSPTGVAFTGSNHYVKNGSNIPQFYVQGDKWQHVPNMVCDENYSNVTLDVAFYRPGKHTAEKRYVYYKGELGYVYGAHIKPDFEIDLPFGIYEVAYCADWSPISDRRTVYVGEQFGDLYYLPIADDTVAVCHHPQQAYSGFVRIPESVEIDGKNYIVGRINEEAFRGCRLLEALLVPSTVKNVGKNAFIYCSGLKHLMFEGAQTPFAYHNYVMAGAEVPSVYAPEAAHKEYSNLLGANHDVYVSITNISSESVQLTDGTAVAQLNVTPAHEAVNGEFLVEPLTVERVLPAAEITGVKFEKGKLLLTVEPNHEGEVKFAVRSAQPSVEPAVLTVRVGEASAIEGIYVDGEGEEPQLFDIQGRRAADAHGFRIVITNGRARKVKY